MKSYIYYISLLFLACMGMTSCTEHEIEEIDDEQYLELTLSCVNLSSTRADDTPSTMGGENDLNENLIKTLHYFLYSCDVTDGNAVNAVLAGKIDVAAGTQKQAIVRIPMDEPTLNNVVFPRPHNDCNVYLIANLPANISEGIDLDGEDGYNNTSINELKALAINSFKNNNDGKSTYQTQESFVMDGEAKATIVSRNKTVAAKGAIQLDRLAAKLTARITVESSFTDGDGTVWTPQISAMKIHLDNAVSNTTLGGTFGESHFDYDQRLSIGTRTKTVEGETKTQYVFAPFYSYPCQWEYLDEDALVMYIQLPWQYTENGSTHYKDCYYKVFPSTLQLDRNSWYNMDLHIGVLGSFSETEEPVIIENYLYKVIDWKNGFSDWSAGLNINTDLLSAHYLVVEQNHYIVNNKNTFEIPFITSHKCIIKNLKVTRRIFKSGSSETPTDENLTTTATTNNWLTLDGNTIKLNHELNNDFIGTTTYDYSPYVFTFTLCHENNQENFKDTIRITQKPAISISARLNSYRQAYVDKKLPTNNNGTNGYQYVNGYTYGMTGNTSQSNPNYGGAQGLNGHNTNPYMYIIEVTVLPAGSDYILGDPRDPNPFTPTDYSKFVSAPGIEGTTSRKLTNYYSTSREASVQNMIAPKFRIASSHGAVAYFISYENAFNRAATYQEDGYPAGRWRVPTLAEVKFVTKLYSDGKIPSLFSSGTTYWHANGNVTPNTNGTVSTSSSTSGDGYTVRCVYDDWYWENSSWPRMASRGNHPDKYNQFTWGDEIPTTNN